MSRPDFICGQPGRLWQRLSATAQQPDPPELDRKLLELMGGLLSLRKEARQVPRSQFNIVDDLRRSLGRECQITHRLLERGERRVRSVQQSRHTAVTRVHALAQIFDVARRQLKLRHQLSEIGYCSAGLGDDRLNVAHHRFVGQQTTDIAFTLLHALHDIRQRFGGTTGIVQNRENLLPGLVDQRPDALGRIPLGPRLTST